MQRKWIALWVCAALGIGFISGCGNTNAVAGADGTAQDAELTSDTTSNDAAPRTSATVDLTDAVTISLNGTTAEMEGNGASVSDGVITIAAGGTYVLSGTLDEGRVLVNAQGEDVTVVLNGADITCSYGSPIYIYQSSSTTIHLMEGTENTLTDGTTYTFADEYSSEVDEEPDACLYSKSDLVLQGAGALTVNANYKNAITSKDTLEIYDLTLTINALNNGINGKDSNRIDSAVIIIGCGGDAIRSTNDTDETLGWVSISNSILDLTAGEDGIQAETFLTMSSGSYTVTSGGGSSVQPSDETSTKGIKAGTGGLTLLSGVYTLDCSDDAVHSNGDVTISGGIYTVSTGDDAFHADEAFTISDGEIQVLTSYEGLEGSRVEISGGTMYVVSTDDGVNAAGGADGSGFGGFGHSNTFASTSSDYDITVSGGYLYVTAGGDGLDSNGSLTISGGTVIVSSTGGADSALDCDGSYTISGGTVLAIDGGMGMDTTPTTSQYTVYIAFDTTLDQGTYVALESGNQSFVFELPVRAATLLFSSPNLAEGETYTVSYGGTYSGEVTDCIGSGGTYADGTQLTELTLSDLLTTYGNTNMRMGGGGRGGMGGGAPAGNASDGTPPQAPGGEKTGGRNHPSGESGTTPAADAEVSP